jgi:hypothetical protein
MFTKIIKNHNGFTEYTKKLINQIDPKHVIELEKAEELGDWVTFNRAWFYIEKLDLKDEFHYDALVMSATDDTITALNVTLIHFEQLEEYEKCAHLHAIKNELKDFLK